MRLRSTIIVCCAAGLLLVTGGPSSLAEGDAFLTRPAVPGGRGWFFTQPSRTIIQPRRQRVAPVVQQRRAAPVIVRDDPAIPKVDVSHHVVVLGDSLASLLADGLDDALNDRPDVAVISRAKADSGLVRSDFHDWAKVATEILAGDQKITVGIMLVGLNDRQALRDGETVLEPGSPRWLELYRDRIDAVAAAFAAKRVPLIWVGAPPVQNGRLSVDLVTFNELYRQRVERAGGQYVDLWNAFVDSENRYTAMGPDVSGQTLRLRLGDGIHFTDAGARKAAHFVDVLIRRLIETSPAPGVVAPPGVIALPVSPETGAPSDPELRDGGIERMIDQMVTSLPGAIGLSAALLARPAAGPILPLTGQVPTGEQTLLASIAEARGRGEAALQLDRIFGEGVAAEPRAGRLDDARWPRRN